MKLALGCPLKFKKECIKQLDLGLIVGRNVSNLYIKAKKLIVGQNVSNLYIKAKNSSERAFLDLVNSFAMSRDFIVKMKYAFGKKLPQDVATDFMKNLKLAFMDLCAAGPADMGKVKTNFAMVKDHIIRECMKLNIDPKNCLDDVAAKFNTIFSQKMQAHEEIMSANNKVVEALKDSKNFDFSKFEPGNLSYKNNRNINGVSSFCGITALNIHHLAAGDILIDSEYGNKNFEKAQFYATFARDLQNILKDPNLRGYSIENLKTIIERQFDGNTVLMNTIKEFSAQKAQSIIDKVDKITPDNVDRNKSPKLIFNALNSIVSEMSNGMFDEDKKAAVDGFIEKTLEKLINLMIPDDKAIEKLSNNEATIKTLQDEGAILKPSGQVKAFMTFLSEVSVNDNLKQSFPVLLKLINSTGFNFSGFAALGGAKDSDSQKTKIDKAMDFFKEFAQIGKDEKKALDFLNKAATRCEDSTDSTTVNFRESPARRALNSVITQLHTLNSPLVTQKAHFYTHLATIKQSLMADSSQLKNLHKINLSKKPEDIKLPDDVKDAKAMEVYKDNKAFSRLMSGDFESFSNDDMKRILNIVDKGNLPHSNVLWNSFVGAGYHLFMADKIEHSNGKLTKVPQFVYQNDALGLEPKVATTVPTKSEALRNDYINGLPQNLKTRMQHTGFGAFNHEFQYKVAGEVTSRINNMAVGVNTLNAMYEKSTQYKRELCLGEMKNDIRYFKGANVMFDEKLKGEYDPEKLLAEGRDENIRAFQKFNQKYAKIPDLYTEALEKRKIMETPSLSKVCSAQGIEPGTLPKGRETAVSLSLMHNFLIDDLKMLNEDNLKSLGLEKADFMDEEEMRFSSERLMLNKKMYEAAVKNEKHEYDQTKFSDEALLIHDTKCENTLKKLETSLGERLDTPLTKSAKLLLKESAKFYMRANANAIVDILTSSESAKYAMDHNLDLSKKEDQEALQNFRSQRAEKYFNAMAELITGNGADSEFKNNINDIVVNGLLGDLNHQSTKELTDALTDALNEKPLNDQDKQLLIRGLKIAAQNINEDSLLATKDAKKSEFSKGLKELKECLLGNTFNEKLAQFYNKYLADDSSMMQSSHVIITHTDNNVKDEKAVSTCIRSKKCASKIIKFLT